MKVLIIKASSMGDIIHTLPAVTDALHMNINISFDWIIEKTFSEIPHWHPAINRVIEINLRSWKSRWYTVSAWQEYYQLFKFLKRKYDVIIDAQGLLKTSLFITNITHGKKYGMDCSSAREFMSGFFCHKRFYINKYQHAVERIRQLFAYSLQYSVPSSVGEYNISQLFPYKACTNLPYLIFFHATTQLKKHWLEASWRMIVQHAINSGFYVKIPYWTKFEELCVRRISKNYNQVIILPKLTLYQMAMQISKATAVISVDTGLSHLTAAIGCPNLTLYGPTNPQLIGTYGLNQIILRAKTKKMENLTALHVWKVFAKFLENYNQKVF